MRALHFTPLHPSSLACLALAITVLLAAGCDGGAAPVDAPVDTEMGWKDTNLPYDGGGEADTGDEADAGDTTDAGTDAGETTDAGSDAGAPLSCDDLPECPAMNGCGPTLTTACCCGVTVFDPSAGGPCCCGVGFAPPNFLMCEVEPPSAAAAQSSSQP